MYFITLEYVQNKRTVARAVLVEAINDKCAQARRKIKPIVKGTNIEQRGQLRLIFKNVDVQLCIDYIYIYRL